MQQITSRRGKGAGRQKDMGLFTKMFGTRSEREVKKLSATVDKVMALEEPYKKLSDDELRAKTQEFKTRLAGGETLDDLLPEAFAAMPRGGKPRARHAPVPRAGRRRHRSASGQNRRNEDRRRQDARRDSSGLPQRAHRRGRSHRHRQRLPCQARLRVDGQGLPLPGAVGGSDRPRPAPLPSAAPPMPRTSPTAPTTSWASTTCATTWRSTKRKWSSAGMHFAIVDEVDSILIDEAQNAADHLRQGRGIVQALRDGGLFCRPAAKSRSSPPPTTRSCRTSTTATTSSTKRTAPSSLTADGHQKGRSSSSAWRTSPIRKTPRSRTTSIRR